MLLLLHVSDSSTLLTRLTKRVNDDGDATLGVRVFHPECKSKSRVALEEPQLAPKESRVALRKSEE